MTTLDQIEEIKKDTESKIKEPCPYAHQEYGKLWLCQNKLTCQNHMQYGFRTLYCLRELRRGE